MARVYRTTTAALIACIIATQCTSTVLASDAERAAPPATSSHLTYNGKPLIALGPRDSDHAQTSLGSVPLSPTESSALRQWGGFRRGRGGRNNGAATAIFLGAVGTIAGAAVLVYANRPECSGNPALGGCGYGTKVIGGAVLSAGLVGLTIGAVTWR
jgi:hypothetical protein